MLTYGFDFNSVRGPRKAIFSVSTMYILSSRSGNLSTRVCLKYDQYLDKKKNGLKEHGTLIIVMKIHCLSYFGRVCLYTHNKNCNSLSETMQAV